MAEYHRRFRIWPQENEAGPARERAYVEGVLFSEGTIVIRVTSGIVAFQDRTVESLTDTSSGVFRGPSNIEWLDGRHRA